jgi:amino acid transporter
VPAEAHPESGFIVSTLMERVYGSGVATVFTLLVLWTAFGSTFALLLGYSRIPFAAAQSGYFFRAFGRLHPTKQFPYVSLLVLGGLSIVAGFFSLGTVIDAMIVTRILVQFMGQVVGLILLRRNAPEMPRPYRMWLYPLPALVALLGWIFLFATTDLRVILFGVGMLVLGGIAFLIWSWRTARWPFPTLGGATT